jgi:hypothetical protein
MGVSSYPYRPTQRTNGARKVSWALSYFYHLLLTCFIPDLARGWTFVNNITQSNKLRTWFTPGGTLERNEFGVNAKVSPVFNSSVLRSLVAIDRSKMF